MFIHFPRAGARAAALLLAATVSLSAPALAGARPTAGALPAAATSSARDARGLTVAVRDLPPGRRTLAQIAAYYYGAPQMSFVLTAANPQLAAFGPDKHLPLSGSRAFVRIPVLRGPRVLGPG